MLAYQQQQQNSASFTGDFSMLQSKLGAPAGGLGASPGEHVEQGHHLGHMQQQHQYGGMPVGNFPGASPYAAHHHPQNVNLNLNLNPTGVAAGGVAGPLMGGGDPNLRHFDGLRAENQNFC